MEGEVAQGCLLQGQGQRAQAWIQEGGRARQLLWLGWLWEALVAPVPWAHNHGRFCFQVSRLLYFSEWFSLCWHCMWWLYIPGARYLEAGSWYHGPAPWYLVPGTWQRHRNARNMPQQRLNNATISVIPEKPHQVHLGKLPRSFHLRFLGFFLHNPNGLTKSQFARQDVDHSNRDPSRVDWRRLRIVDKHSGH